MLGYVDLLALTASLERPLHVPVSLQSTLQKRLRLHGLRENVETSAPVGDGSLSSKVDGHAEAGPSEGQLSVRGVHFLAERQPQDSLGPGSFQQQSAAAPCKLFM